MTVMKAAKILIQCRLVVTHFRDVGYGAIRSIMRWYNHKNEVVGCAIITKFLSSLTIYQGKRISRFSRPDEISELCSIIPPSRVTTTDLHKSTQGHTKAFIKRMTGNDALLAQVMAFSVRRTEGQSVIMSHFKAAA